MLDADGIVEHLQGMIDWIEENKDDEYVFLVGDFVGKYSLNAGRDADVKKIGPIGYPKAVFQNEDDIRDLRDGNTAIFGTIALPRKHLSKEGQKLLDGEIDEIEADSSGESTK